MRKQIIAACLAVTAMAVTAAPPAEAARTVCKDRDEIIKVLGKKFGETQRSFGLQNDMRVLELYASANGTWTAILTMPSGRSCVIAAGEAWTTVPPIPIGEPA